MFHRSRGALGRHLGQPVRHRMSTFSLYTPEESRASIATFLARLPGPEASWVDEHLLVVVGGSRRDHAEPHGPASPASAALPHHALPVRAGRASQAPSGRPGGRAQITPAGAAVAGAALDAEPAPNG